MRRLFDCGAYSTAALILKIVKNILRLFSITRAKQCFKSIVTVLTISKI